MADKPKYRYACVMTTTPITSGLRQHRDESMNAFSVRRVTTAAKEVSLRELRERLEKAAESLTTLKESSASPMSAKRLKGKIEGVKLAQSYVDEAIRMLDR